MPGEQIIEILDNDVVEVQTYQWSVELLDLTAPITIGDPVDTSLPVVENIQPAPGTALAMSQALQFDVIDDSGDFRRIIVMTKMLSQNTFEVVHDGANFGPKYQDPSNTRVAILDGYRYTVKRDGGWFKGFTLTLVPVAIDKSGNENVQT